MKKISFYKNSHLILATTIVVPVALTYGIFPSYFLPRLLDFKVLTTDLHSIFRSIMGLYLAFSFLWVLGIAKSHYWQAATISCFLFMLGLASGRIISLVCDGVPSLIFSLGTVGELLIAVFCYYQFKKHNNSTF